MRTHGFIAACAADADISIPIAPPPVRAHGIQSGVMNACALRGCPVLARFWLGRGFFPRACFSFSRPRVLRYGTAPLMRPGECNRRACVAVRLPSAAARSASLDYPAREFARRWASIGPSVSSWFRAIRFRWLTPHTSMFSTDARTQSARHFFRKSLQFRAIARTRQVLTPSMPRNLCRNFLAKPAMKNFVSRFAALLAHFCPGPLRNRSQNFFSPRSALSDFSSVCSAAFQPAVVMASCRHSSVPSVVNRPSSPLPEA